ncbi:arylamine N-acetyltransferase [Lentzea tibetensis]|uniref:Arylamine N-acetyltransferase n=1 Tax=Lentzea tibetensis TaxID=2591470 RepID=A0A563ELQ7_9PSEU|nr:arylamine N-acetyltransferase [Lentzea tibetensis]TWP48085.1 arylamine N-acetyltransferase [Lentzea tibetensis]
MDDYLARIGATRDSSLTELHERHLLTVPFENLDIHLGTRIVLDEEAFLDKIVTRRRGGFCYELNGAFAWLLRSLGHEVKLLSARVFMSAGGLTPPFDHMALLVDDAWLADVGFGKFTLHPLRWDSREDQTDPYGVCRLIDNDGDVEVHKDDEPQYVLDTRPRTLDEFGPACWWQQTAPESQFLRGPVCSMSTPDGRVTLSGTTLIRTVGEEKTEEDVDDVLAVYSSVFGFSLPHADFRQSNAAGFLPSLPV